MEQQYAIELRGITKTFGSVVANNGVDLNVKPGEILALLGENGSGKTTLMNMLSGIYKPDSGQIFVDGKEVSIDSPEDSKRLGIGMVHQHFKLVDNYTVAENIVLGMEPKKRALGLFPMVDTHKQYFTNKDTDALHPNDAGHERMARTLMYQLIAHPCTF